MTQQSPAVEVPDEIPLDDYADPESKAYRRGWNDCREEMLRNIAKPSPCITEQATIIYDLDKMSWDAIKLAAKESGWIPKEYFMNDWVSDVCSFLRNRRIYSITEQDAVDIIEDYMYWKNHDAFRDSSPQQWCKESSGRALLKKLNRC